MDRFTRTTPIQAAQASAHMHGHPTATAQASLASARLEALEAAVRQLEARAVQQEADGRLHLPAGTRLRIQLGRTCLQLDITGVLLEANGEVIIDARGGSSTHTPASSPAASGGGIQQMAASQGGWQSAAQQGSISNPRHAPPGTEVSL